MSDDAIVTREKVEEYLALTTEARAKVTPCAQGSEDEARLETMMSPSFHGVRRPPPRLRSHQLLSCMA